MKSSTFTDRAPRGLFSIPNSVEDMMKKIENTYNMWFQVWNCEYLPLVMDRPKWQEEEENLKVQDLVYFKLTDSKLSADWRLGIVEYVNTGRDGKVRSVGVSYKIMVEDDSKLYHEDFEWKSSVVERPARAVVKLMNIEDTSILEDMNKVKDLVKEILDKQKSSDEDNQKCTADLDSNENLDMKADGQSSADDAKTVKKKTVKLGSEKKSKKIKNKKSKIVNLIQEKELKISPDKKTSVSRSRKKTPSQSKQMNDDKFQVQKDLANSFSDEKQTKVNTDVVLDVGAEVMAEMLDNMGAEVLD